MSETSPHPNELAPDGETARQLAALRAELAVHAGNGESAAIEQLSASLERVERQFARAGKELFKANARAQAQPPDDWQQRAHNAEAENARLRAQLLAAREEHRQTNGDELATALLPALDGLDEALAAGARLLEAATPRGWWEKLRAQWGGAEPTISAQRARAWLEGAALVRERLLGVLAEAQVRPLNAQGEFDPHQHRAVETVPATDQHASGVIVSERRRGYRSGDRVVRFAEVVVAREETRTQSGSDVVKSA